MTSLSDEKLVAYADGELSDEEAADIRKQLRDDAEARSRLAMFESSARLAKEAFSDVLREPVPEHLMSAVGAPPRQDGSTAGQGGIWRWLFGPAVPLAGASLLAGMAIMFALKPGDPNVTGKPGLDVAVLNPPVMELLETKPSFESVDWEADGDARRAMPVATFIGDGGRYCREFELTRRSAEGTQTTFAVACRGAGGTWALTAMVPAAQTNGEAGDGFQPASGARAGVEQMFEALRTGSVVSAEDEAALITRAWSKPAASGS